MAFMFTNQLIHLPNEIHISRVQTHEHSYEIFIDFPAQAVCLPVFRQLRFNTTLVFFFIFSKLKKAPADTLLSLSSHNSLSSGCPFF
jgi:hypothetical protein